MWLRREYQALAEAQQGTLVLWMPVALGAGIAGYFAAAQEPGIGFLGLIAACAAGLLAFAVRWPAWRAPLILLALLVAGFLNAALSANLAVAPVLAARFYGQVTGRIAAVDRATSGRARLLLEAVTLAGMRPAETPKYVRVTLHYPKVHIPLEPGRIIMLSAHLAPPSGPAEPGGFDFRRHAWFKQLGGIGYSRSPVLEAAPPKVSGPLQRLSYLRVRLAEGIRTRLPGRSGAFAAALLTGDRAGIDADVLETLRASNLAHLLAISGLHMGLLTGFVFATLRLLLVMVPGVADRWPLKKIAATGALMAALAYLALSGGNVATIRAFVMVAVMLTAVLVDRRAVTLRSVAIAALIVLGFRPESLIEAGFQMSFAATGALVAVFALLRDRGPGIFVGKGRGRALLRNAATLVMSSLVAGLATAPVAAMHFNRMAAYGMLANLASVPVMGSLVMPAGVVASLLAPFGLDGAVWWVMGQGIDWILAVAEYVASLDGAVRGIKAPVAIVSPLLAAGGLLMMLGRGRLRPMGLLPLVAAFGFWASSPRPDVLVSADGMLVGVIGADGRWLSRAKGQGFVAERWLENDGDLALQADAAARTAPGTEDSRPPLLFHLAKSLPVDGSLRPICTSGLLVAPRIDLSTPGCVVIDRRFLAREGSVAIRFADDRWQITTARALAGDRLWTRP